MDLCHSTLSISASKIQYQLGSCTNVASLDDGWTFGRTQKMRVGQSKNKASFSQLPKKWHFLGLTPDTQCTFILVVSKVRLRWFMSACCTVVSFYCVDHTDWTYEEHSAHNRKCLCRPNSPVWTVRSRDWLLVCRPRLCERGGDGVRGHSLTSPPHPVGSSFGRVHWTMAKEEKEGIGLYEA